MKDVFRPKRVIARMAYDLICSLPLDDLDTYHQSIADRLDLPVSVVKDAEVTALGHTDYAAKFAYQLEEILERRQQTNDLH